MNHSPSEILVVPHEKFVKIWGGSWGYSGFDFGGVGYCLGDKSPKYKSNAPSFRNSPKYTSSDSSKAFSIHFSVNTTISKKQSITISYQLQDSDEETPSGEKNGGFNMSDAETEAATRIQAVARGHRTRKHLDEVKAALESPESPSGRANDGWGDFERGEAELNAAISGEVDPEDDENEESVAKPNESENQAASQIQALARGRQARREVEEMRQREEAATKIQSVARGRRVRQNREVVDDGNVEEEAAIKIQAVARGSQVRRAHAEEELEEERRAEAATRIQAVARGRRVRQSANEADSKESVPEHSEMMDEEMAAVKIQAIARGANVRRQRRHVPEDEDGLEDLLGEEDAAIRIQAAARGRLGRLELRKRQAREAERRLFREEEEEEEEEEGGIVYGGGGNDRKVVYGGGGNHQKVDYGGGGNNQKVVYGGLRGKKVVAGSGAEAVRELRRLEEEEEEEESGYGSKRSEERYVRDRAGVEVELQELEREMAQAKRVVQRVGNAGIPIPSESSKRRGGGVGGGGEVRLRSERRELEDTLEATAQAVHILSTRLGEMHEKYNALAARFRLARDRARAAEGELERVQRSRSRLSPIKERYQATAEDDAAETKAWAEALKEGLERQLGDMEEKLQDREAALRETRAQLIDAQQETETNQREIARWRNALRTAKQDAGAARGQAQVLQDQIRRYDTENESLRTENEQLRAELHAARTEASMQQETIELLTTSRDEAEHEADTLRQQIQKLQQRPPPRKRRQ